MGRSTPSRRSARTPTPRPLGGQIVKVLLIVLGVGTLFYALVTVTEFFVAGHLADLLAERRTQKMIDATTDHYIICGYGRVGRQVARDLRAAGARYVVIDDDPENRELAPGVGVRFIEGEASEDEVLRQAGIERARGVIACVDSDAENIFITLTARELSPTSRSSRAPPPRTPSASCCAPAPTRVISPYKASGAEMARLALQPAGLRRRRRRARSTAWRRSSSRPAARARASRSATCAAARSSWECAPLDGSFHPQPPTETVLGAGDVVMAMGTVRTMQRLEKLFAPAHTETRS